MISNYFKILDESNSQILTLIDKYTIDKHQYFPIFGFSRINQNINNCSVLKELQRVNIRNSINSMKESNKIDHTSINSIMGDIKISATYKSNSVIYNIINVNLNLNEVETYLREYLDKKSTNYRKMLCAYDSKNLI